MATYLQPDKIITEKIGNTTIKIKQKLIPDGTRATKKIASYIQIGDLVKPNKKISGTGKPKGITVHNTNDIKTSESTNPAEQYARATHPNGNMNGVVVHYWVYKTEIWQQLRDDERGWHAADGSSRRTDHRGTKTGGNIDTIAIECIESKSDSVTEDTLAKLVALLCSKYDLDPKYDVYTHNYWMHGKDKIFSNVSKNCPIYILDHWDKFLDEVQKYYDTIKSKSTETTKVTVTGYVSTGSEADKNTIWNFLYNKIGNPYGVAGIMGNLYAESGLKSNNLQNTYERKFEFTDSSYTNAVDNGLYTANFANDKAGYGLAQWTYYTRKKELLEYAKSKNKSIADLTTQLEFLYKELSTDYNSLLVKLKSAKSVVEASNNFLLDFERPANQSESVKDKRAKYSQEYYDKFAKKESQSNTTTEKETVEDDLSYKINDIVQFDGSVHYTSSYKTAVAKQCKPGKAKVTNIVKQTSNQPYYVHLKKVSDGGSSVNGWVDPKFISVIKDDIKVGSIVKIKSGVNKFSNGEPMKSIVSKMFLYVRAIEENGTVYLLSTHKTGEVYTGRVNASDVIKVL